MLHYGLNWKPCLSLCLTNETFIGQLSFSGSQTCEQNLSLSLCVFKGILIKWLIARYYPLNMACVPHSSAPLCRERDWLMITFWVLFAEGWTVLCLLARLRAALRTVFILKMKTGGCFYFLQQHFVLTGLSTTYLGIKTLISALILMQFNVKISQQPLQLSLQTLNIMGFNFSFKSFFRSIVSCAIDPAVSYSFCLQFDDIWSHVTSKTLLEGFILLWL